MKYIYRITLVHTITDEERYWYVEAGNEFEAFELACEAFNNDGEHTPIWDVCWVELQVGGFH